MEDHVHVSLRSVEGCGINGKNSVNWRLFTKTGDCLQKALSGNSELAGRKIVGVASVAKCW